MSRCIRCRVRGRVQGVFFRASTQHRAQQLGISGHARNLPDGSVEVLACGPDAALAELQAWLWEGPPSARVSAVDCTPVDATPPAGFTTA